MQDGPSRTAYRVALSRAAHLLLDQPVVLADPLAPAIVGEQGVREIRAAPWRFRLPLARHLRAFLVARGCLAEQTLADVLRRGVRQYVVLGAGLDTFAYRNPYSGQQLEVFEVDHPATQAWKRRQLAAAGIAQPASLTFVSVDFESETLRERLASAGFRSGAPALFSWLGVTMYLTRAALHGTLSYVASLPAGSGIVFDYAVPPATLSLARRVVVRTVMRHVAAAGEPWQSFLAPGELAGELRALGFTRLEDFGPAELNARFFAGRGDGLQVGGLGRVMSARK